MSTTRLDFRYVDVEYDLWALRHMLDVIEPAIAFLSAQDEARTIEEIRRNGWERDEAEVDLAHQDVHERSERVLPRFMRGPFVVALWACFESGVRTVAETRAAEVEAPIPLDDLKESPFLKQARRYFDSLLKMPLDVDEPRYQRLADLSVVRNALAHANGSRHAMSAARWRKVVVALGRQGLDVKDSPGLVILTQAYCERAYNDVNGSLRDLVNRARSTPRKPSSRLRSTGSATS